MKRAILGVWLGQISLLTMSLGSLQAEFPPAPPPSDSLPQGNTPDRLAPPVGPGDTVVKPLRPAAALQEGIKHYRQGDHEVAAAYFEQANSGKSQLSANEKHQLEDYMRRNTADMQGRQQAVQLLQQCEKLVQAGKGQEAEGMLRTLKTSKHLKNEEMKRVNQLWEQVHPKSSRSWNPFQRDSNRAPNADTLLAEAKKALAQKDYDKAEMYANEAKKAGYSSLLPWSETPDDVLKEVSKARLRASAGDKPSPVPNANADVLLSEARKALERGDLDRAESLANQAKARGYSAVLLWSDTPEKVIKDVQAARKKQLSAQAATKPAELTATQKQAKELCVQARRAVQAGDLAAAKSLLAQAEALKSNLPWWEDPSPDKIRREIAEAELQTRPITQTSTTSGTKPDSSKPSPATPLKPLQASEVRPAVKQARQLLEAKKLDEAEALAKRARLVTGIRYGLFEDTPDKIIADVNKVRESQNHEKAEELLTQARQQLKLGNLTEAENLAYKARSLRSDYPIWHRGERPDRVLADIRLKKQQAKVTLPPIQSDERKPDNTTAGRQPLPADLAARKMHAQTLLAEARQHLQANRLAQAMVIAGQVRSMGLTFGPHEDSPDAIKQAVEALQAQQLARENPQAAAAKREQALLLLSQAAEAHRQGQLLQALALAKQAQDCKAIFHAGDRTPDAVIVELQNTGRQHIETYSAGARTWRSMEKYREAEQCLTYVRDLQAAFGMDTHAVSQQLAEVQRLASGQPVAVKPVGNEGQRLLQEARAELKRGEFQRAQQLARQVYEGPFELRVEASHVLAEIDEALHRQSIKEANQFYELGFTAFKRGEYAQAAAYLKSINMRLLDERKRAHAQEILASKQLQPHALMQTQGAPILPEHVTVEPTPPTKPALQKPSVLAEVQARQEIELQRLRALKLQSEGHANKLVQQGDLNGAIETLKLVLDQVRSSGLEHEQALAMQRQLEEKIRQLGNLSDQQKFEKLKRSELANRNSRVEQRVLAEQSRKEQVAALLEQYNAFYKEAKYKEAETVAMKAREIDPDNQAAELAYLRARTHRSLTADQRIIEQKQAGFAHVQRDTSASSVIPERDFTYDEDFQERTKHRRGRTSHHVRPESQEDRETKAKLTTMVSIDFRDKPLSDVLDHLRTLYGVNIVQDEPALQQAGISTAQPVSIRLSNTQLKTALTRILHNARLTYVIRDGIVIVTTPEGSRDKLIQVVYPVADLVVPVENYGTVGVNNNPFLSSLQPTNQQLPAISGAQPWAHTGVPVSHSASASANPMSPVPSPTQPYQRQDRPRGSTIEDILIRLITDTISPKSWDTSGGPGHIDYYPLGMSLVVSADPEIQEQIDLLLNRLRELQELQVTVEVRFITLSEAFYERIGVDFDVEVDDDETRFDPLVVAGQFAPGGFINESDHLDNVVVGMQPAGAFTSDLDIPFRSSSFERAIPPFGNFPNSIGNNGGIDFGIAFLSDIEVFMFVEAAQGDTRTNVMQAPKITLFNGQTANLSVQDFQYLVNGIQLVPQANGQISTVPQITPFPSGLTLALQAVVSADRRYVRLSLGPQFSSLSQNVPLFPFPLTFQPIIADDIAGPPVTITQFIQLPQISTLSVSTTVTVPDGGTILMGGFKTLSEGRTEFGPPILSKIPYINRLFRNVGYGREARTLLMMITPRIIIPEEEEERLGQTFAF